MSVYSLFRTGTRVYQQAGLALDVNQNYRVAFNTLSRDLHQAYYRAETEYNIRYRRLQDELIQMIRQNEEAVLDDAERQDIPSAATKVDFSFIGTDNDTLDSLEFTIRRSPVRHDIFGENTRNFGGFERIAYYVNDRQQLVRSTDLYFAQEDDLLHSGKLDPEVEAELMNLSDDLLDLLQPMTLQTTSPLEIVLAENIVEFDLSYLYFSGNQWRYAESWDSEEKGNRNPIDEQMLEMENRRGYEIVRWDSLYPDNLPAAVQIVVGFRGRKEAVVRRFSMTIEVPLSQETWEKNPDIDDISMSGL
jgi:hypothetical protein